MIAGISYKGVAATRQEKPPYQYLGRKPEPSRIENQTLNTNLEGERLN